MAPILLITTANVSLCPKNILNFRGNEGVYVGKYLVFLYRVLLKSNLVYTVNQGTGSLVTTVGPEN